MHPNATRDGRTATGARHFFAPTGPRPHAKRASKKSLQQPPERPLLQPAMLEGRSTGGTAAASKWNRLPDLQGGAQMGVPRPLAHTQRGGLGGGWRPFCTHPEVGVDVLRGEQACARANHHPPRPPQAPRRARGSPLCARGEAKVSCGPRSGVGGGVRKTG